MSTPMSKEEAESFFDDLFLGKHHIPTMHRHGTGWAVHVSNDLATYDGDNLTRLVFLAHQYGYRAELSPAMRYIRLAIHKRPLREGGSMWERHPTLTQAITHFARET